MYLPVNFRTMNPDVVLSYRCASWVGWRIVWQQEGCTQQASMLISAMFCIMSQVCRFGNNYHTSRNHTWAIYIFLVERLVLHNLLHDPDCKIMTSSFFCGSSGLLCKCIILLYIQVTAWALYYMAPRDLISLYCLPCICGIHLICLTVTSVTLS